MRLFPIVALVLVMLTLVAGCTNRAIYDNIQLDNRRQCVEVPPSQYDECMEATSKPYDEYKRERDELKDG